MKNLKITSDYTKLNQRFYDLSKATPLKNPQLISYSKEFLNSIGITDEMIVSDEFTNMINGQSPFLDNPTFAMGYAGHQFGYFVPQLGDGRALNIGKLENYNLQLKGAGVTKYSRNGDGRAVLRSSIREYLMSEAMHGLGIPTSRAGAIIASDSTAYREDTEACSIVLRASSSWVRFGTFEFAYISEDDRESKLKELSDYVINETYPHLKDVENKYEEMYFAIVDKTLEMIVLWQSVGFMHGVMNTDNLSIAGLTIDYGPYAFMEEFEKEYICNHSDYEGRYRFDNQPFIAYWNLMVLAKVLSPIASHDMMENYNNQFIGRFKMKYFELMSEKLGLVLSSDIDSRLVLDLFAMLENDKIDYTPFFYFISCGAFDEVIKMSKNPDNTKEWLKKYQNRLEIEDISSTQRYKNMRKINPKYILKNYILQEVIKECEKGDYSLLNEVLEIAKTPYDEHTKYERYSKATPKDVGGLICSCSS